jgi:energy-coupling factor transporter ATP-binding protein EcfA2
MAVPASELAAAALELFQLAQKQGWLDRLSAAFKKNHRVLVLGCSGAGKTAFLESLTGAVPAAISRLNRTEFAQDHRIKISKSLFTFVDTPGQEGHTDLRLDAARRQRKPIAGIINVTAYGFHEGNIGKASAVSAGQAKASYLAAKREEEIRATAEWIGVFGSRDYASWLITVVNKADLWWRDRDAVIEHYTKGAYGKKMAAAKELRPVAIEHCSVFQPFFGEAPMDGIFGDADRIRMRGHLLKQLLAAIEKEKQ